MGGDPFHLKKQACRQWQRGQGSGQRWREMGRGKKRWAETGRDSRGVRLRLMDSSRGSREVG
jgi:hypothetical protein